MNDAAKQQNKRRGVLICGAYGYGNAGDDAILEAIVAQMRELDPDIPITVLSRRPEETRSRYGVAALHTFNVPGFLRVMRGAKLYINGGGSLIQDVTSRRSLWYYLFTLAAAKRLGSRVIMYGCGIGPVNRGYDRRLTRKVLDNYVDVITLREGHSLEELRSYGVTRPDMVLASDPALSLRPADGAAVDAELRRQEIDPHGRYIAFALRRWPGFAERAHCFAAAARHAYEEHGLIPIFLSINHRNDGEASDLACKDLADIPHHIIRSPMSPALTIGILGRMTAVVSMRLHGLIFAAGAGLPLVGVSYDPKVTAFLDYIGQELYVQLEELTPETLCRLTDMAVARAGDREQLLEQARRLAEIEHRNTDYARRLLES
jgi:polysaccharide pyruvyl transferase CsaB